jgi:16S rRNA (adenine1518-N6/adenine1519-N6)-dimethyltransferase
MSKKKAAKGKLDSMAFSPSKTRGQNFIINPFVVEAILEFGRPLPSESLVEIGPGLGALTEVLYQVARQGEERQAGRPLVLIEIEPKLCAELARKFPGARIIEADVRHVDLSSLGDNLTVFGNLPYSFSTEILFHILKHRLAIRRAVFMLQREFAERVAAEPGSKKYSSLSVAVQLWAEVTLGPIIPGDAFHPPTKVESCMLELSLRPEAAVSVESFELFERVVKTAFSKRRRTIENSLESSGFFSEEVIRLGLAKAQIDPGLRAEMLGLEQFAALVRAIDELQREG